MKLAVAVAIAVFFVPSLVGGLATASPGCDCPSDVIYPLQRSETASVTRIAPNAEWIASYDKDPSQAQNLIEAETGAVIELQWTAHPTVPGTYRVRPERRLTPNTMYRYGPSVEVITTAEDDVTPPSVTGLTVTGLTHSGACPSTINAEIRTATVSDDTTPSDVLFYKVRLRPEGEDEETTFYVGSMIDGSDNIGQPGRVAFGSSDGFCPNTFPDAELDASYTAIVSVIDQAGNESAATTTTFRFAKTEGCGCSSTGTTNETPATLVAAFALLLVVARPRRVMG